MLISMLLEDMLDNLGYQSTGPANNIAQAERLIAAREFDIAILDMNLNGASSLPLARLLAANGIPFIFATGYGDAGLPNGFAGTTLLSKPFNQEALAVALSGVMAQASATRGGTS